MFQKTLKGKKSGKQLDGCKVAILACDGFEQSELFEPKQALEKAGAQTAIVSLKTGEIKGWAKDEWGESIAVDQTLDTASPADFDSLLIPGGVMSPDKLRTNKKAVAFVREFLDSGRPIAAICHGPQMLIDTGLVGGKNLTSWPSLKIDLMNAGANWSDEEVVTDNGLVTSRKPEDIPAFNKKMIEEFSEGSHPPGIDEARMDSESPLLS
jgi:protease I